MEILTTATEAYIQSFSGFVGQFINWGQTLFAALLVLNFIWLCFWYAFDRTSITQSLSDFLKKAFIVMLFYTFMLHPSWLTSILKTSAFMGKQLTGIPIDPSSIIANGIAIANKIILPVTRSSLLTIGTSAIVILLAYGIILFCFIAIALDLAVTLITSSALVAVSPLFLGFSALRATSQIARQTLDVILGNAVKLLGIYLTVGAGAKTIGFITQTIPTELISFDPYCWIVAAALLFWQVARHLPCQLARIVTGAIHDHHGAEMAAAAMTSVRMLPTAMNTMKLAAAGATGAGKALGSVAHNALVRMSSSSSAKLSGTASDVVRSGVGTLSDHFKNMMNKSVGGSGTHSSGQPVPGFSERMFHATQDFKAQQENAKQQTKTTSDKPISKPIAKEHQS